MKNFNNCNPDVPAFIDNCQRPVPFIPPCPTVIEGMNLYQSVNCLSDKVNLSISTYNDVMANCYETLHNLERAAEENGAYYGSREVWTEQGYLAEESATYTLIHKAQCDRRGEPITMQMHLAYGNTTNSAITQDIFSSSKITYADKIFPAIPPLAGGWYGNVIYNGAPLPSRSEPTLYSVGFTCGGKMRVYNNAVTIDQMKRDTIVNSMGCAGQIIKDSAVAPVDYMKNIPLYDTQQSRVLMGQNYETNEVIWLVCGNKNDVNEKGMTTAAGAAILVMYGCDIAVELTEGINSAACDKGSMIFAPDNNNVPATYASWFISRKCFYKTDYERELAELMQNYGLTIWGNYLQNFTIADLTTALATETAERKAEDAILQLNIDTEAATRLEQDTLLQTNINTVNSNSIDRDTTLQLNIDTAVADSVARDGVLQTNIDTAVEDSKARDTVLQTNIDTAVADSVARDAVLQTNITAEETVRIAGDASLEASKLNRDGDTMTGKLTMQNANIQLSNSNGDTAILTPTTISMDNIFSVNTDNVNVGSKPIINLADPVQRQDATTKDYVDKANILQDGLTTTAITNEANARKNADTILQTNITTETQARITALTNEATTRANADTALSTRLSTEVSDRTTAVSAVTTALNTEVTTRQVAIKTLNDGLVAEATARQNSDGILDNKINKEIADRIAEDNKKLNLTGGTINGVLLTTQPPTADMQVATKKYVDQATGGGAFAFLPLSGGTMTGALNLAEAPTRDLEAATKKYVDDTVQGGAVGEGYLPLTGGTMTGFLTLNAKPVNALDASTKSYVDDIATTAHTDLNTAIGVVATSVTTEETAREVADTAIALTVTDEVNARVLAVSGVSTALDTETAERKAEDLLLLPKAGGTITGNLVVPSISGLDAPTAPDNAVNKSYVDTAIAGVSGAAVTQKYVDDEVATRATLTGDTFTGDIFVSENKITTPEANITYTDVGKGTATFNTYISGVEAPQNKTVIDRTGVTVNEYDTAGNSKGNVSLEHDCVEIYKNDNDRAVMLYRSGLTFDDGNGLITGLLEPVNGNQAATKNYADKMLPLTGGTLTDLLTLNAPQINSNVIKIHNTAGDNINVSPYNVSFITDTGVINNKGVIRGLAKPVSVSDATNKEYVDTQDAKYLPLTGGEMNGNLVVAYNALLKTVINGTHINFNQGSTINAGKILGLSSPINPNDATNKSYVDTETAKYLPLAGGEMSGMLTFNRGNTTSIEVKHLLNSTKISPASMSCINTHANNGGVTGIYAGSMQLTDAKGVNSVFKTASNIIFRENSVLAPVGVVDGLAPPVSKYQAVNKDYVDAPNTRIPASKLGIYTINHQSFKRLELVSGNAIGSYVYGGFGDVYCELRFEGDVTFKAGITNFRMDYTTVYPTLNIKEGTIGGTFDGMLVTGFLTQREGKMTISFLNEYGAATYTDGVIYCHIAFQTSSY